MSTRIVLGKRGTQLFFISLFAKELRPLLSPPFASPDFAGQDQTPSKYAST